MLFSFVANKLFSCKIKTPLRKMKEKSKQRYLQWSNSGIPPPLPEWDLSGSGICNFSFSIIPLVHFKTNTNSGHAFKTIALPLFTRGGFFRKILFIFRLKRLTFSQENFKIDLLCQVFNKTTTSIIALIFMAKIMRQGITV